MSALEKAIVLRQEMPEQSVETVYRFMQSLQNEYVKQADSLNGLRVLQSFSGTLPESFDYRQELEEARAMQNRVYSP